MDGRYNILWRFYHNPGLIRDSAGKLWLACFNGGISHIDPDTWTFTHFSHDDNDPNSLPSNSTFDFLEASDGAIWIAAQGGLSRLDPKTGQFFNFTPERNHLSDEVVEDIFEDSWGVIWVCTDNGLNKFNPQTQTFTNYYIKDGLPSNHINGLIEDNQGYLWISTYRGIARFDPQTETFRNYDVRDGLQDDQFSMALYKSESGELFMGGVNGFNTFYPDRLADNPNIPQVVLTDFQLRNKPVAIGGDSPLKRHINVTRKITLPYDYTVLTIKFAALNFRSPAKNQYAYKLEGFDQDWVYTDSTQRFATYTNLDSGKYTFRVKASNNDGVWNETGATLAITIMPPLWDTWWFRGTAAAVLLALAFTGYWLRIRSIEQRSRELERQVAARTHELAESNQQLQLAKDTAEAARHSAELANQAKSVFLAHMSHELRTPMNAILGYSQLMQRDISLHREQREQLNIINRSGEHLLTLINDVLEISKIEAGQAALDTSSFDIRAFLHHFEDLFDSSMDAKGLYFEMIGIDDLPQYVATDENKLRQVLINLLGNAVKFTKRRVKAAPSALRSVSDRPGRRMSKRGSQSNM